jgi:hypothetical protein
MPVADLFAPDGVFKFANKNLDRAAFQSDHWTFLHIPKTAGSSYREEIANALQPDYNIEVNYHDLDPINTSRDFTAKMHAALTRYVAQGFFERTKFASGHFTFQEINEFDEFRRSKLISMLREPISRLRSDYLFRTSPEHPIWEAEVGRYPNFRTYVEDTDNQDVMYRYLCRDESEPVQDGIHFILQRYTFIGLQEMYVLSIKAVFLLLGQRIEPQLRLRNNHEIAGRAQPMAPDDIALARELNSKDVFMFEFFREQFETIKSAFFAHTDFDRIFRKLNGLPFRPFI